MSMTKIKLFSANSVNSGFKLNVSIFRCLGYRYLRNCDESWYHIECCSTIFRYRSLSSNKTYPLVVLVLTVTCSGKI